MLSILAQGHIDNNEGTHISIVDVWKVERGTGMTGIEYGCQTSPLGQTFDPLKGQLHGLSGYWRYSHYLMHCVVVDVMLIPRKVLVVTGDNVFVHSFLLLVYCEMTVRMRLAIDFTLVCFGLFLVAMALIAVSSMSRSLRKPETS